jgi:hypothetical protein
MATADLLAVQALSKECMEYTLTDPRGTGWFDQSGEESSDKCAWKFDQRVRLADGTTWLIQGNWSNAAYLAGTGFPTRDKKPLYGCLYNNGAKFERVRRGGPGSPVRCSWTGPGAAP